MYIITCVYTLVFTKYIMYSFLIWYIYTHTHIHIYIYIYVLYNIYIEITLSICFLWHTITSNLISIQQKSVTTFTSEASISVSTCLEAIVGPLATLINIWMTVNVIHIMFIYYVCIHTTVRSNIHTNINIYYILYIIIVYIYIIIIVTATCI